MKIAIVSRGDRFTGGASRGAEESAHWLIEEGHEIAHFCREFQGTPAPFQKQLYAGTGGSAAHYLNAISKRLGFINAFPFEYYLRLRQVQDEFDLFHFHDLSSAISIETLSQLSKRKPVVFTVHDCSAFTGGCIYPMGCEKYKTRCDACPQLGKWPLSTKFDRTCFMQEQRRRAAGASSIQYVFPSQWIQQTMLSAMPLARPGRQISNAIDAAQMVPMNKKEARRKLGLPEDRPVVLISAPDLADERKGVAYAVEALCQAFDLSPILISAGHSNQSLTFQVGDIPFTSFGHIRQPDRLALVYSAADVFLFPSLADNCPYSVLETMACGTAVVGFATGGIPEIVISGETGMLVPPPDRDQLAASLRSALQNLPLTQKWGVQARQRIENHFNKASLVSTLGNLYEEYVRDWRPTP